MQPFAIRRRGNPCSVHLVRFDAPLVMGVVNVTPDSFSDGGDHATTAAAVAHGQALAAAGAQILDVGGEATNPRARPVSAELELARVIPVIERLAATTAALLSVDTTKAAVARAAIAAGADLVNDVSGGAFDPEIVGVADDAGVGYVLGHLRGASLAEVFAREAAVPRTAVVDELGARVAALPSSLRHRTMVDPGVGFGKGADPVTNLALLAHAGDLGRALGRPVVVGPSRKRFLTRVIGDDPEDPSIRRRRLDAATVGTCVAAVVGGAQVVRVHDVARVARALAMNEVVCRGYQSRIATARGDV